MAPGTKRLINYTVCYIINLHIILYALLSFTNIICIKIIISQQLDCAYINTIV